MANHGGLDGANCELRFLEIATGELLETLPLSMQELEGGDSAKIDIALVSTRDIARGEEVCLGEPQP